MHPSKLFHTSDTRHLCDLIEDYPFALIIASAGSKPVATHTPVLVDRDATNGPTFRFHTAKANPITDMIGEANSALLIATGPHAYISPDWYNFGPDQVPTWNYLSAEAEGQIQTLDRDETHSFLDDLSTRFETELAPKQPWTLNNLPTEKYAALVNGITAFRLIPERLEGVVKLNQNKSETARRGVIDALAGTPLAERMEEI
ncbi:MAG: FMN-binding negative transcriptional regulator [Pseudomonadota bacterium]